MLVTAAPDILEERLRERGMHSRFEHEGSSHAETALYQETTGPLTEDGLDLLEYTTGHEPPQAVASTIADHPYQSKGLITRKPSPWT
ncbi:hypothetical protein [Acrocarpospora sp. B8E8]|uniref:hypothetical protein n=1 Tax=Acrocarpospora sp. B8E8 TaxID=3153572 RepID=UPI00325CD385